MEWFTEYYDGCAIKIKIKRKIAEKDGLQKIEIFETSEFGRMLVLDGRIQFTEFDEPFYHEMLVHVPMLTHPSPKKVLIIGGGDGGAVREVLKHNPDKVTLVEIDSNVIDMCKRFIGIDEGSLDDARLDIVVDDGKKFLEDSEEFDVIIVDSTDPVNVSITLFDEDFFDLASRKCSVFCCQSQSPLIQRDYFRMILKNSVSFKKRRVYLGFVPTYPLGMWSFLLAGDIERFYEERFWMIEGKTKYYNPGIHKSAFSLPEWLKEEVKCI
ncbi:spermidine synthase [Archaeoglobales archaeon]|nr:MAG: spermidine synthase [Archaeoglobales archaeon]